jgi:porin
MNNVRISCVAAFLLLVAASGYSQENSHSQEKMAGMKSWLDQFGITLESSYKGEFWANMRGGYKQKQTHLHNIDIAASVDTKRAGLWNNGTIFFHVLSNPGGRLLTEEIIGDSQTVSNIEAPHSTRLYEIWHEQMFYDGKLSFLAGIHDLNSEFAMSAQGALFINSSFGISKDISAGARPSIFPLSAPAIRTKYSPSTAWDFMLGIYSGDPGDPSVHRHFPSIAFSRSGGALIAFETNYHFGSAISPGSIKAGYWRNTGRFEDVVDIDSGGTPRSHMGNEGFYLIAEKMLVAAESSRGLGAFLQISSTPNRSINEFISYVGAGLRYMGLFNHRRMDELGVAVAHARVNDRLVGGLGRDNSETVLEITYRAAISRHFAIQPDVQFVLNPGAAAPIKNAMVGGIRFEMEF